MGWTFKTLDNDPLIITPDEDEHSPQTGTFYDKHIECIDIDAYWNHPETDDIVVRISVQEYNELRGIRMPQVNLSGNGWPSKDFDMQSRQKKALAKNPMHTTMTDYKTSNPDSVVSRARNKNMKRMKKRNVEVKHHGTKLS